MEDQFTRAYLCGRILAVLIREGIAEGSGFSPQQLYKQALTNPAQSIPSLLGALYAQGKGEQIADLVAQLAPNALGITLTKNEQGEFAVGYAHEMANISPSEIQTDQNDSALEEGLNDRWNIRMRSDLKFWALSHGGSKLVRDLLEGARKNWKEGLS